MVSSPDRHFFRVKWCVFRVDIPPSFLTLFISSRIDIWFNCARAMRLTIPWETQRRLRRLPTRDRRRGQLYLKTSRSEHEISISFQRVVASPARLFFSGEQCVFHVDLGRRFLTLSTDLRFAATSTI